MKKSELYFGVAISLLAVSGLIIVANNNGKIEFRVTASDNTLWYHYEAVAAKAYRHGSKEFWANCSTHDFSLSLPDSSNILEGVAFNTTEYFNELDESDDRYIAPIEIEWDGAVSGHTFSYIDVLSLEKGTSQYDQFNSTYQGATLSFTNDSWSCHIPNGYIPQTGNGTYTQDGTSLAAHQNKETTFDNGDEPQMPPDPIPTYVISGTISGALLTWSSMGMSISFGFES